MKKKFLILTAFTLSVIMSAVGLGCFAAPAQTAYAQTAAAQDIIADRNDVNVSVNGNTVKLTAYKIDGYNYFRVADICSTLNMKVFPYLTDAGDGVKIVSNEPFDGSAELPPTEQRLNVTVKDISVYYDGAGYIAAKSFNFNDRNYIKLADIVTAANSSYEINLTSAQEHAINGIGQAITMRPSTFNLKTIFDDATDTITVMKEKTDFQALYEELYTKEQGKAPLEAADTKMQPVITPKPELTQAPEIGTTLAKILINPSELAYIDGEVNFENYSPPYAKSLIGQCTWYAKGRFEEVTGSACLDGESVYDLDRTDKNPLLKVITEPELIEARSVAVFDGVHVLFVEYIERDEYGNPLFIYFTEANIGNDGIYKQNVDCMVQKLEFSKFISRQGIYEGCIVLE